LRNARSALDCGDSFTALEGGRLSKFRVELASDAFPEELQRNCSSPKASGERDRRLFVTREALWTAGIRSPLWKAAGFGSSASTVQSVHSLQKSCKGIAAVPGRFARQQEDIHAS